MSLTPKQERSMRQITRIEIYFIPSMITKDDPLAQRSYFGWKATVDGIQYGRYVDLGHVVELPQDRLAALTAEMLTSIETIRRMTPEEIAASGAKEAA